MLLKQLLKCTVLQCQQPENNCLGTGIALYAQLSLNAGKEKRGEKSAHGEGVKNDVFKRKAMREE